MLLFCCILYHDITIVPVLLYFLYINDRKQVKIARGCI